MTRQPILFGDIHNHNACGYGIGSMERTIEIARGHLDFFAFTGHSSWHDMEPMEGGREQHWIKGFARLADEWPNVQSLIADANGRDDFAAFLGFEWHSSRFGDQCVIFPDDHQPLCYAESVPELRAFCKDREALMIPHHLAYPEGRRGVNWDVFDECCTPVVEIFSEHGNSEHDRGPFDFFNHSMGGRQTSQTVRAALEQGMRFGFTASSDSHNGFPGAYGEGLVAVLAEGPERAQILDAIRARRTYAITGDRIEVDFTVEGAQMGSTIDTGAEVEVAYDIRGRDELDVVEVIQDGQVVHRSFPETPLPGQGDGVPFQIRLEWGWGPWGDLALSRTTDWDFDVTLDRGRILRAFPCFQSGPYDADRRHRLTRQSETRLGVVSFTSRRGAYRENPNQGLIVELDAPADAALDLTLRQPIADRTRTSLAQVWKGSVHGFAGPFPQEAWQWHRIVPRAASHLRDSVRLAVPRDRPSHVYLRVRQHNGQMAWVSPVFLNHR